MESRQRVMSGKSWEDVNLPLCAFHILDQGWRFQLVWNISVANWAVTCRGLQLSLTYFPAELFSSQRRVPPLKNFVLVRRISLKVKVGSFSVSRMMTADWTGELHIKCWYIYLRQKSYCLLRNTKREVIQHFCNFSALPFRNRSKDFFHHCKMFSVVMRLE